MTASEEEKEYSRIQTCVLQAAQELGYSCLKPAQGQDVFASFPTGFGISICYACLPAAFDADNKKERSHSIAVVVTPLPAIMKDQVRKGSG